MNLSNLKIVMVTELVMTHKIICFIDAIHYIFYRSNLTTQILLINFHSL